MYRVLILSLFLLITQIGHSQTSTKLSHDEAIEYAKKHYVKREVMIPMRDGVKLFTSIYEPKDKSKKHPILMNRTCYSASPYGEDNFMRFYSPTWSTYIENGYIMVFQDVRGKNKSEGTFQDLRKYVQDKKNKTDTDEVSDTYDTVEWLLKNTNSNGNVGVFGISYPGFYSTMAALSGHPAIKAVSPQAPVTDWFRGDDAHHNGAFFILDMFSFQYWFEHVNNSDFWENMTVSGKKNPTEIVGADVYTDYLRMGTVKNFTKLLGDSCVMWNDIVAHPNLDEWWEERNVSYYCRNIKPAVMVVGGLFDAEDCYGSFITYKAIKNQSPKTELYLVEGPWSHGSWSRGGKTYLGDIYFGDSIAVDYYIRNIEYPFFAYYLEGKGSKPSAEARIFHTGENKWHEYPEGWQPKNEATAFYLNLDGTISTTPQYSTEVTSYVSDPKHPVPFIGTPVSSRPTEYMLADQRFASTRPDVAVFSTPVLTDSLCVAGEVSAELEVMLNTTDADFVVKIIDVYPDNYEYPDSIQKLVSPSAPMSGYQMLVRGEIVRGKYRNALDIDSVAFYSTSTKAMRNYHFSTANPEPFVPGKPTKVRFRIPDIAHTFMPGHKLMVQIQSSWFPLVDMNPQVFTNIYECDDSEFQPCTVSILHSEENPTIIWLPVQKR